MPLDLNTVLTPILLQAISIFSETPSTYGSKRIGGFSVSSLVVDSFSFASLFRFDLTRCRGYPFCLKMLCRCVISLFIVSVSHILLALSTRHRIVQDFTRGWWCEENGVYLSVFVGFLYTVVVTLPLSLLIRTSKKLI